jgi:glycine cleavage system H protein
MPSPDILKENPVARIQGIDYPEGLLYDVDNQIWYEPLAEGTVRAGFTPWAAKMMGGVLVFTPKRIGREFERGRSFAVVEGGKWVGSAHAAFDGSMVSHNELLMQKPELLEEGFGQAWMVTVRPTRADWRAGLITGDAIGPAFEAWIRGERYKEKQAN